jgi:hypothetical protein
MLRALDWKVPGEGILIRLVVDARDEDQVTDTPLKSHIISTVLAQLIEAADVISWDLDDDEIEVEQFLETLEESLDILRDRLHGFHPQNNQ